MSVNRRRQVLHVVADDLHLARRNVNQRNLIIRLGDIIFNMQDIAFVFFIFKSFEKM